MLPWLRNEYEELEDEMDKTTLINTIQNKRAHLESLIAPLSETQLCTVTSEGQWSIKDILQQFIGRIEHAFGSLAHVKGRRILDIACGSNTSKAPASFFVDTPFGERTIKVAATRAYTAQFEPWFCRILLELGADPVGVDIGDLDGEAFEHYYVNLGIPGALDFFTSHSFDALQDSRLFGSPECTTLFPERSQRLKVAEEMKKQEQRLLKKDGIIIHSDIA